MAIRPCNGHIVGTRVGNRTVIVGITIAGGYICDTVTSIERSTLARITRGIGIATDTGVRVDSSNKIKP